MSNFSKKFFVLALVAAVTLSISGTSYAASDSENSVTVFFRRLFNYPVKATEKTGEMTGNALNNTGENLSKAGESAADTLSGKGEDGMNKAGESIAGGFEATGQAVSETAQIPVKAAEEAPQQ